MKALIVCHGNINRSAAIHVLLLSAGVKPEDIDSCGFVNPGRRMAKKMREALLRSGAVDPRIVDAHRSKTITEELAKKANLLLYMDGGNLSRLQAMFPQYQHKFRCLGDYGDPKVSRVPDPAFMKKGSQQFDSVVKLLTTLATNLRRTL